MIYFFLRFVFSKGPNISFSGFEIYCLKASTPIEIIFKTASILASPVDAPGGTEVIISTAWLLITLSVAFTAGATVHTAAPPANVPYKAITLIHLIYHSLSGSTSKSRIVILTELFSGHASPLGSTPITGLFPT